MANVLTKPKKVGRPMLPKGEAKGKIVPVRFNADDLKQVTAAAKVSKQTISEWMRRILVDFKMSGDDWNKVMAMFGKARTEYSRRNNQSRASEADQAIALVQHIMMELAE